MTTASWLDPISMGNVPPPTTPRMTDNRSQLKNVRSFAIFISRPTIFRKTYHSDRVLPNQCYQTWQQEDNKMHLFQRQHGEKDPAIQHATIPLLNLSSEFASLPRSSLMVLTPILDCVSPGDRLERRRKITLSQRDCASNFLGDRKKPISSRTVKGTGPWVWRACLHHNHTTT